MGYLPWSPSGLHGEWRSCGPGRCQEGGMAPPLTLLDLDFSKDLAFNVSAFDGFDQSHNDVFNVSAFAEQANILLLEASIGTARDGGYGHKCKSSGLGIFSFLLMLVYLLSILNTLLASTMANIMINGESVSIFQALLLAFIGGGFTNISNINVSNTNNNNNNNNMNMNMNGGKRRRRKRSALEDQLLLHSVSVLKRALADESVVVGLERGGGESELVERLFRKVSDDALQLFQISRLRGKPGVQPCLAQSNLFRQNPFLNASYSQP